MINLDKKTIYPENYPSSIYKIGEVSRTDILVDYLSSKEKLDIFTPKKALLRQKNCKLYILLDTIMHIGIIMEPLLGI